MTPTRSVCGCLCLSSRCYVGVYLYFYMLNSNDVYVTYLILATVVSLPDNNPHTSTLILTYHL